MSSPDFDPIQKLIDESEYKIVEDLIDAIHIASNVEERALDGDTNFPTAEELDDIVGATLEQHRKLN